MMKKDRLLMFNTMVSKKYKLYKICQKNIMVKEVAILNNEFELPDMLWKGFILVNYVTKLVLCNNFEPMVKFTKKTLDSMMYIVLGMKFIEGFRELYSKRKLDKLSKVLREEGIFVDFYDANIKVVNEDEYSTIIHLSNAQNNEKIFSNSREVIYSDADRTVDITNTVENTLNKNILRRRNYKNK